MRSVVTALIIVTLLAIWLITQYPDDGGPNEVLTRHEVTPVTMPREPGLPIADQEVSQATVPDEVISDTESTTEPTELKASADTTVQTSVIELDPEQRGKIVAFLSKRGLAVVDSERIADSAMNATKECVGRAFGSNGATSTQIETCMFNVLAAYGLNEVAGPD
jgi:hypothetical protein